MKHILLSLMVAAGAALAAPAPQTISGTPSVPALRGQILEAARTNTPLIWQEAVCYSEADEKEVADFARENKVRLTIIRPSTRTPYSRLSSEHNPAFTKLHVTEWKEGEASFEKLLTLPRQALESDWYATETTPLQFAVAFDGKNLWLLTQRAPLPAKAKHASETDEEQAKAAPEPQAEEKPTKKEEQPEITVVKDGYTPEAHTADHSMLGLSNYQANIFWEIDLTPDGRWWCCFYDRVHPGAEPKQGLKGKHAPETRTLASPEGPIAMMRLPLGGLTAINTETARGVIGGIFGNTVMTGGKDITGKPDLLRPSGWPFTTLFEPF